MKNKLGLVSQNQMNRECNVTKESDRENGGISANVSAANRSVFVYFLSVFILKGIVRNIAKEV